MDRYVEVHFHLKHRQYYLLKLSKLRYIMSVSDTSTASSRKSLLGIVGSNLWLESPEFLDIHRSDPSNLTAPRRATTKCAVARSGPSVS